MRRGALTFLGVAALVIVLCLGLSQLLSLRMESGDVYPPYSSLRADPLGIKALSDALATLPNVEVRRSFRPPPLSDIPVGAIIFAGASHKEFAEHVVHQSRPASIPARVSMGSRAVFTFPPEVIEREVKPRATPVRPPKQETPAPAKSTPEPADKKTDKKAAEPKKDRGARPKSPTLKKKTEEEDVDDDRSDVSLAELWGVSFRIRRGPSEQPFNSPAELQKSDSGLEETTPWHSSLYFEDLSPAWRVIYASKGKPVVIERAWGEGTVVLASDSYFLSNEALHGDGRNPRLLSWLVGPHALVVFDEEHHRISEDPGVMMLMRKYRLQGVLAGLGLLAILFVWQQAVPFAPKPRRAEETDVVSGRSSEEGLVTLLRRSVPQPVLLETCIGEWRKSTTSPLPERDRVETAWASVRIAAEKPKNVVENYRTLLSALRRRRP